MKNKKKKKKKTKKKKKKMDNEDDISVLELDEAVIQAMGLSLEADYDDDDDEDFEEVEELTLPLVSEWMLPDGLSVCGVEVPVMKDDDFITDSMYVFEDPPPHVFDSPLPTKADACSICFEQWTFRHHFCCVACGHIFGAPCIQKWLKTKKKCPQCKMVCTLDDVRLLFATPLCIPAADKGVADQKISTRCFPFSKHGRVIFRKFEIGRRNLALKKISDAEKRLAGLEGRRNDLIKRQTDFLDMKASMLRWATALEQQEDDMYRVDELQLQADALGKWAEEYLQRAKACDGRTEALCRRIRAYNQRVMAFEERLQYFSAHFDAAAALT